MEKRSDKKIEVGILQFAAAVFLHPGIIVPQWVLQSLKGQLSKMTSTLAAKTNLIREKDLEVLVSIILNWRVTYC